MKILGKRKLTPYGIEIKKRLLEKNLTQKEFCEKFGIGQTRLSEMLYGAAPGYKYRKIIEKALK
ncbi:helix-turn-helix transcriptional regulator [Anoxynatronum buryatiense]|uniref:helix-turn-helix transcriptional regulator n=1 Tax=Anoxynatronum buryatiense TaxID=489973 RepID=UPI0024B86A53|nr:helix-turn-helix transcriptional regulator [Anoxynatronum buryatiense]